MKHSNIILTIVISIATLCSCNKNVSSVTNEKEGANASMIIKLDGVFGSSTKASADEMRVHDLDIMIFDENGVLEWNRHYTNKSSSAYTVTGLNAGAKTVAIVVNKVIEITDNMSLNELLSIETELVENDRTNFIMFGKATGYAAERPETISVHIKRLAAKINFFQSIKCQWDDAAPYSFEITDIYVTNVGSKCTFGQVSQKPDVSLRNGELTTDNRLLNLTYAAAGTPKWVNGRVFNDGVSFYVYPNSDPELRTTIIIKALFDGNACYYPIVLDRDIESNTGYNIGEVLITCKGMPEQDEDFSKIKAVFDAGIDDWYPISIGEQEF